MTENMSNIHWTFVHFSLADPPRLRLSHSLIIGDTAPFARVVCLRTLHHSDCSWCGSSLSWSSFASSNTPYSSWLLCAIGRNTSRKGARSSLLEVCRLQRWVIGVENPLQRWSRLEVFSCYKFSKSIYQMVYSIDKHRQKHELDFYFRPCIFLGVFGRTLPQRWRHKKSAT